MRDEGFRKVVEGGGQEIYNALHLLIVAGDLSKQDEQLGVGYAARHLRTFSMNSRARLQPNGLLVDCFLF
jgi:hypothetical protein